MSQNDLLIQLNDSLPSSITEEPENEVQIEPIQVANVQKVRIQSLDVYRGLTMVGMILVDNMGPVNNPPWFLDHAQWDGLTPADLVFPAFLFIMGMAIPLAVSKKRPLRIRNLLRIAGLFFIGFFLNLLGKKFDFSHVRIPGILQRLAICYAAILFLHVATGYASKTKRKLGVLSMFVIYLLYLAYMIPYQESSECLVGHNLTDPCNFAGHLDRIIFTKDHIYKYNYTDPQGLFSTLNAIVTTYCGYYYSLLMSRYKKNNKKLLFSWLSLSVIIGILVYPMTLLMPLNKKIYSASFTLIVVAVSGTVLSFFYTVVDLVPRRWPQTSKLIENVTAPLKWLGMNPLAIFVLMDMVAIFMVTYIKIDNISLWTHFYREAFASWISSPPVAATVFAVFFLLLWTVVAGLMYRFKLFVRL